MRAHFLDPGLFRTELALERATLTGDQLGGHVETWGEVATVLALVEPIAVTARFGADQTLEEATHRISVRFRADLASGRRLRKGTRIFDIVTVHDPDESGRYLVCRTREKRL